MRRAKVAIVVFITYIVLAVGISMLTPGKGQSQSPPPTFNVKVSNTPLPVTGNISSTVTGNVNASQSGAWNVGLTGTPNVNVANSPTVDAQQKGDWTVGISGTPTVDTGLGGKFDTANSHLSNVEAQANKLAFDGSNNLKVALPGPQDVNIVGGSVSTGLAPATRGAHVMLSIAPNSPQSWNVPGGGVYVSTLTLLTVGGSPTVSLYGPNGIELYLGDVGSGRTISFPRPIPITSVSAYNWNIIDGATLFVNLIGD